MSSIRSSTSSLKQSIDLPPSLLEGLSYERLRELIDRDDEFIAFFSQLELDEVKRIQRARDNITNTNRQLALENNERRPYYEEKKAQLTDTAFTAKELRESYDRKYRQLKSMAGTVDRNELLKDLQSSCKESEKESDELAENYLSGIIEMSSDDFINSYLTSRKSYWARKVKVDKLEEIARCPAPYQAPPTQSIPVPQQSSIPPYHSNKRTSLPLPNVSPSQGNHYPMNKQESLPPYQSFAYNNRPAPTPPMQAHPTSSMPGYPPYPGGQSGGYPQPTYSYRPPPGGPPYGPPPTQSYRPPPVGQPYRPPPQPPTESIYQQRPYYSGYPPRR